MRVGIFIADSNGGYPVPASRGGAVSTLVEHLVSLNNEKRLLNLDIISIYDKRAEIRSRDYPNVHFIWIKSPKIFAFLDSILYDFVKIFCKRKKKISYKSLMSLAYYIISASKTLKKAKYDKVVLENNVPLAWIIKLSNYSGDYYYHLHNVPRINAKCKGIFEECKAFLCVSQFVADQICLPSNPIGPVQKSKVKILYNCVDTEKFYPCIANKDKNNIKVAYGFQPTDKVIVFVGRLSKEKGIDKLLAAVGRVEIEDIKVLIVGSFSHGANTYDNYQRYLHRLAEDLGDKIRFTGYVPQSQIPNIYRCADIAVLPSVWDEPAGLTMVEAMACGIPVITTCVGGIPEYVGENGVLLERNGQLVENIAKNIQEILSNPSKVSVSQAVSRVDKYFDKSNYLERFLYSLI